MPENPEPDAFVVRFDGRELWRLRGVCLAGIVLCLLVVWLSLAWEATGSGVIFRLLAMVAMPLGVLLCFATIVTSFAWARRPAFVADRGGITVGFRYQRPFRVAWEDVERISREFYGDDEALAFRLRPEAEAERFIASWWNPHDATGRPILLVRLRLLDATWHEISDGLNAMLPVDQDDRRALRDFARDLGTKLRDWLTHGGDLVSLEDYRRVFRRAPLGSWSDSVYSVSPADSSVGFCREGTGWAGYGAPMMFGYSTELEWRERQEDYAIDIRRAEEGAKWLTFDYDFHEHEGKVVIRLDERLSEEPINEDDLEEDLDDWTSAFFALMSYGGPCRGDR